MQSVILNTVVDVTLLLHTFDPGGCTKDCPFDEYASEAVSIVHLFKEQLYRNALVDKETVRTLLLPNIVREVIRDSFDGCLTTKDARVYDDIAAGVWNIYHDNIEKYGRRKRAKI